MAVIVRIGAVDLNVQFTKKKIFSIQFIYTPTRPTSFDEAQSLAFERLPQIQRDRLGIALGEPKAANKYSWILPQDRFKFESIDALIAELVRLKSVIDSDSSNS